MMHEKISSEVIEMERQEQEEKQEIQQQLAMNSKEGRVQKTVADEAKLQEFIGKVVNEWGGSSGCINYLCWRQAWIVQSDGRSR